MFCSIYLRFELFFVINTIFTHILPEMQTVQASELLYILQKINVEMCLEDTSAPNGWGQFPRQGEGSTGCQDMCKLIENPRCATFLAGMYFGKVL